MTLIPNRVAKNIPFIMLKLIVNIDIITMFYFTNITKINWIMEFDLWPIIDYFSLKKIE